MIRRILLAWQRRIFRRSYPMGVHVSDIVQLDYEKYQFEITNLKNGKSLPVVYTGTCAILKTSLRRAEFIDSFLDAGVRVEEGGSYSPA